MRKQILALSLMMALTGSVNAMAYETTPPQNSTDTVAGTVKTGEAGTEIGNKICPISGHKVGEMGAVVQQEYQGKTYNFCCSMCLKDFNKDPAKYSKIAEDEAAQSTDAAK